MSGTKSESLYVRQLHLGPMKNFVCLVGAASSDEAAVIDPAWDVEAILRTLAQDSKRLVAIVLTHHHHDHVNGVPELLARHDLPVYAQRAEVPALSAFASALEPVQPGEVIQAGPLPITCLHTPGHTPGSQCLHCGGALFSGDTLFVNACGRCDLPGGDAAQLHDSLHRVLGALDDATVVYPGHDYGDVPVSTLGRERAHNPYLKAAQRADFIALRTRPR